jgi:hypothetical protein
MEALQTMQMPQNGADLVQYVAAVNWMRNAIPKYSKRVVPLKESLAKLFEGKSRRTKKVVAAVSLLHLWGPEEQAAFKDLQAAIMDSMTLPFSDPGKMICFLTDASDHFYAGLVSPNICPTIFYHVRALDRCYQYTALRAGSATSIEVCNRSAHSEGINGCQPHNLITLLLLAAPTRSAHGRAGATGSVRHKRVRCNSDMVTQII